jgi:hypothetical protein
MPRNPTHPLLLAFSGLWALLSALWPDTGPWLDPNGATGDNGSALEPDGR